MKREREKPAEFDSGEVYKDWGKTIEKLETAETRTIEARQTKGVRKRKR